MCVGVQQLLQVKQQAVKEQQSVAGPQAEAPEKEASQSGAEVEEKHLQREGERKGLGEGQRRAGEGGRETWSCGPETPWQ